MNLAAQKVLARPSNWLPLPFGLEALEPELPDDKLFKGEVVEYFPRQGIGTVRAFSGTEYAFTVTELDRHDTKPLQLKVGCKVGFDLSQSALGLRIKRMKVY